MPCSIHHKSPIKPPRGLIYFKPIWGGGGLRETWGLVRDGVSLHFPPGVNTTPIFFRNRINNNNNNNNNREGSGRTSLDSTAIDALLIVFILFYFFKQLKETFEF